MRRALLVSLPLWLACASQGEQSSTAGEPQSTSSAPRAPAGSPPVTPPATSATAARPVPPEEDGDVLPGRRTFRGMVRSAKDGYEVRGILIEDAALPRALARSAVDGLPTDPAWFVGAVVRVTAEVTRHEDPPPRAGGLAEQRREGSWLSASEVEFAEIVARAEMIEGAIARSKGFFQVGAYLVRREDLAWSLVAHGGGQEGSRVRLWGQPRVVRCDPRAQCLEGGSLPIFDVGRAEQVAP